MLSKALALMGVGFAACAPFRPACPTPPSWHRIDETAKEKEERPAEPEEAYQLFSRGKMALLSSKANQPTPHNVDLYPEYFCYLGAALCHCGDIDRANENLQRYYDSPPQGTPKPDQKLCPKRPYYRKSQFWKVIGSAAGVGVLGVSIYFAVQYSLLRVPTR